MLSKWQGDFVLSGSAVERIPMDEDSRRSSANSRLLVTLLAPPRLRSSSNHVCPQNI